MLSAALSDSGWFIPLERVGLQNLLTERKIIRANLERTGGQDLAALQAANLLFEGGIIAFDSNIRTGGAGAGSFLYTLDGVPLRAAGFANVNGLFEAAGFH